MPWRSSSPSGSGVLTVRLWLIRHAKSSWSTSARSDFDRPLNQRGERDGPAMRDWLAGHPHPAEWIWTSDAARAAATAAFVAEAFPGARLQADHRLYGASPSVLVEVVRTTPPAIATAAIVAHNPGITECVNLLTGGGNDRQHAHLRRRAVGVAGRRSCAGTGLGPLAGADEPQAAALPVALTQIGQSGPNRAGRGPRNASESSRARQPERSGRCRCRWTAR